MATMRDLTVRIRANADEFDAAMKASGLSARAFSAELRKLEQAEARRERAMTQTGAGLVAFGATVATGLGLAAKAAIDWESAWAGVTKTVDGSAPQMVALEESLRQLARELPATHQEIAAVAEAAGALGVKREDIVAFTRTMINLGETTDLTSDAAATALARISNVMGTSGDDIDRFGAALVDLGNNGASTESEIVSMAQRIAGAAKQVGLSEGDLLGIASALSSVGIEAEAGGSSFSTFLIRMTEAVNDGGDKLDQFAAVAGMSAQEFATGFRDNAAGAATAFVEGLGRIQKSGGDTFGVLADLGLSEIRLRDALLRSAGAGDLMAESIRIGNEAWAENSALTEEAAKRYETTAARLQIARNQMSDFAITVGETFLPIVGAAADRMGSWMEVIRDLPDPVVQAGSVIGSLAGAASLAAGGFFLAAPKIADFKRSIDDLGPRAQGFARGLQGIGSFLLGPWGLAIGAGITALALWGDNKARAAAEAREFTRAIEADSGALGENTAALVSNRLEEEGLLGVADRLRISKEDLAAAIYNNGDAYDRVTEQLRAYIDSTSEGSVRDGTATAAKKEHAREARNLLTTIDELRGQIDAGLAGAEAKAALDKAQADAQALLADETGAHTEALGENTDAMDEAAATAKGLKDALDGLTGTQRSATEAEIRYRDGVQKLTEALKENGGTFDLNTEAGRRNMDALLGVTGRSQDYQAALFELTQDIGETTAAGEAHRAKLVDIVTQSIGNRAEAEKLVDRFLAQAGATDIATEASRKAEEQSRFYKDELGRLAGLANGDLKAAILGARDDFDTLGGAHASAEERARAQVGMLLNLARNASPELRAEFARLAEDLLNLPDGTFQVTGTGITQFRFSSTGEVKARGMTGLATGGVIGFADAGIMPGYTPGRDVHRFWSPTAGGLELSGGEPVMRPEFGAVVGHDWVNAANAAARTGGVSAVRDFLSDSWFGGGQRFATGGVVRLGEQPFSTLGSKIHQRVGRDLYDRMGPMLLAQVKELNEAAAAISGVFTGGPPGRGVERWRPMVNQALGIMGQPSAFANLTLRRMNQESGGNPNIVNKWDINWIRGYPSVGLMQVIRPTYAANRHPAYDLGPYSYGVSVNPLANTLASMRYALRRYGSLPTAYNRRGGYDDGGIAGDSGWMWKGTVRPERVLSPRQTEAFEQLVRILDTHRGAQLGGRAQAGAAPVHKHYHLTVHDAGNGRIDLEAQFSRLEMRAGVSGA